MRARRWIVMASAVAVVAAVAPPGTAIATSALGDEPNAAPHDIELLSLTSDDQDLGWDAITQDISADGNVVLFSSAYGDYSGEPLSDTYHGFARDRAAGTTVLVDVRADGTPTESGTSTMSASGDGRYVAFHSIDSEVVPGDANGATDVFLRDLELGTTVLVSASVDGGTADDGSYYPVVSADGRYVVFESRADDLVEGVTVAEDNVFVRDMVTGDVALVSRGLDREPANEHVELRDLSPDGRFVVMASAATNLTRRERDRAVDVFLLDQSTDKIIKVSDARGKDGSHAYWGEVTADGGTVVFSSKAQLLAGDTNRWYDVFAYDVATKTIELVSTSHKGGFPRGHSENPEISADGRFVSYEADKVRAQVKGLPGCFFDNVIVRDLESETASVVGLTEDGLCPDKKVGSDALSDSGYVVFSTPAHLVAQDIDRSSDVFGVDLS